jgi:hypothetical protein
MPMPCHEDFSVNLAARRLAVPVMYLRLTFRPRHLILLDVWMALKSHPLLLLVDWQPREMSWPVPWVHP